jgi:hypothetical protein
VSTIWDAAALPRRARIDYLAVLLAPAARKRGILTIDSAPLEILMEPLIRKVLTQRSAEALRHRGSSAAASRLGAT